MYLQMHKVNANGKCIEQSVSQHIQMKEVCPKMNNHKPLNILITSAGRRTYLVEYFKEALEGCGTVHVSNSTDLSPTFRVADHAVVTPLIYDPDYIPFLLDYCKKHDIDALLSVFDVDLPVLAKHKDAFAKENVKIIVSDPSVIEICNDKVRTFQFLLEHGFYTPMTYTDLDEAKNAIASGELKFPLIIKPRWGMGSIGVYEAENEDELDVFYKRTRRDIASTYLRYESDAAPERNTLIQEKIVGGQYCLDVINDFDAQCVAVIVKKKTAMRVGEAYAAMTVDYPLLKEEGERLGRTLAHIGNLDVDIILQDGNPYFLEMNARFGGAYPFSHLAGVNLPKVIVQWLRREPHDPSLLIAEPNIVSFHDILPVIIESEDAKKA